METRSHLKNPKPGFESLRFYRLLRRDPLRSGPPPAWGTGVGSHRHAVGGRRAADSEAAATS